jgi:hypothetical protein
MDYRLSAHVIQLKGEGEMTSSSGTRCRQLPFLIALLLLIAACGQPSQPAATAEPTATAAPATAEPTSTTEPTATTEPATAEPTATTQPATAEPTATALPVIDLDMQLPEGDATRGFPTAVRNRCQPCHANPNYPSFGPRFESSAELPRVWERGELRLADPMYEGSATTNWEYIIESTLLPEAYLVPGEWEEAMPTYYADRIEDQDLADIIAWMATCE